MSANILVATENMPHDVWLDYRRQGIGGSDAAAVCGINRYKSSVELWMEKTGRTPTSPVGEAAYWGTRLEPVVRAEFIARTGLEVTQRKEILQSVEYPFMIANLDGECFDDDKGLCIFEAKTSSTYRAAEWSGGIPDEYYLQIQHYMAVTGYQAAYVAVLIGGNSFRWQLIERDEELISMLIKLEAGFWQYVESDTPPPIDGTEASARLLADRFPSSRESRIVLPPEADDLLAAYDDACEQLEAATEDKKRAENQLKELLGENEAGTTKNRIVSWKTVSQERLDSKVLKSELPDIYKKYSKPSSYRRFTVKLL